MSLTMYWTKNGSIPSQETDGTEGWQQVPAHPKKMLPRKLMGHFLKRSELSWPIWSTLKNMACPLPCSIGYYASQLFKIQNSTVPKPCDFPRMTN